MNLLLLSLALLGCLAITVSTTERSPPPTGLGCNGLGCFPKNGNGKRESAAEEAEEYAHANSCHCSALGICYEWKDGKFQKVPFCPTLKRQKIVEKSGAVEKREAAAKKRYPCYCTGKDKCYERRPGGLAKVPFCTGKREVSEEVVEKSGAVEKRESAEESAGGIDTNIQCPRCSKTPGKREASEEIVEKREAVEEEHGCHFLVCDRPNAKSNRGCKKVPCDMEFEDVEKREAVEKSGAEEVDTTIRKREAAFGFKSCMCNNGECEQCDDQGCETVASCTGKRAVSEEIVEKREVVESEGFRP